MPNVEVNLPNIPEGADVSVPYLGKFKNGETSEVSDLRWGRYLRNQPGAKEVEDGVLRLTREAIQQQHKDLVESRKEANQRGQEQSKSGRERRPEPPSVPPQSQRPQLVEPNEEG